MTSPSTLELHNAIIDPPYTRVREGWRQITTLPGDVFAGFSEERPNTGEITHYIFTKSKAHDGYCAIYDEKFTLMNVTSLGRIVSTPAITHGTVDRAMLINSPGLNFPLYGIQGYGVKIAKKADSINEDTTSLVIGKGLACAFGDRFCWAEGSTLHFNDPGDEGQLAFVAENRITVDSPIQHIEQADRGTLLAFCSNGIYTIAADALGKGQFVEGFRAYLPGYEARHPLCAATSNGVTAALVRQGIVAINQGYELLPLPDGIYKHFLTNDWKPIDFRDGRIYKTSFGFAVEYSPYILMIDIKLRYAAVHYIPGSSLTLRGVLKTSDGLDMFLLGDPSSNLSTVAMPFGSRDDYTSTGFVDGYVGGVIPTDPTQSLVIREVWPSSDNGGEPTLVYVRGQGSKVSTKTTRENGQIIGTDVWSSTTTMGSRELRGTRHQFNVRTDYVSVELGVRGSTRIIGEFDIKFWGRGINRDD